ncbi:hypothetical protein T484DRAFT_1892940 [Baffinella frigidus]|nr:hypothetical protein T484DRAFT_1892940 [Cryptophyta sp. CCMP2293]
MEDGEEEGDKSGQGVERVVLLGTGAAAPFKYRTVSSIYVALEDGGGVILDAGDGTYGGLVRKFGEAEASRILTSLKMIFVSHKHADHISGVARLLTKRSQALKLLHGGSTSEQGAKEYPFSCRKCGAAFSHFTSPAMLTTACGAAFSHFSSLNMHHRAAHPRLPGPKGRVPCHDP